MWAKNVKVRRLESPNFLGPQLAQKSNMLVLVAAVSSTPHYTLVARVAD